MVDVQLGGALSADMNPSQFTYKPKSISLTSQVDENALDRVETFSPFHAQCADPAITTSILTALLASPSLTVEFQCPVLSAALETRG